MTRKRLLAIAVVTVLFILNVCFSPAKAQETVISDKELGQIYSGRDYKKMEEIAKTGDARAQVWAGLMLQHESRYKEAREWYRLAAEQNNSSAISQIASLYEQGLGTPTDYSAAENWYKRGAESGNKSHQISYAHYLLTGKGGNKDEAKALKWFLAAAAQRENSAYMPLAKMYAEGKGTEPDLVKAYAYAELAEYWVDDSDYDTPKKAGVLKKKLEENLSKAQTEQAEAIVRQIEPEHDKHVIEVITSDYLVAGFFLGILATIMGTIYGVYWLARRVVRFFRA